MFTTTTFNAYPHSLFMLIRIRLVRWLMRQLGMCPPRHKKVLNYWVREAQLKRKLDVAMLIAILMLGVLMMGSICSIEWHWLNTTTSIILLFGSMISMILTPAPYWLGVDLISKSFEKYQQPIYY